MEDLRQQTATSQVCKWLHNHDGALDAAQQESLGALRHRRSVVGIIVEWPRPCLDAFYGPSPRSGTKLI